VPFRGLFLEQFDDDVTVHVIYVFTVDEKLCIRLNEFYVFITNAWKTVNLLVDEKND
jgi:hypothetical protein